MLVRFGFWARTNHAHDKQLPHPQQRVKTPNANSISWGRFEISVLTLLSQAGNESTCLSFLTTAHLVSNFGVREICEAAQCCHTLPTQKNQDPNNFLSVGIAWTGGTVLNWVSTGLGKATGAGNLPI